MTNGVLDIAAQQATASLSLWSGWIQLGFAGFALVLICVLIWVLRQGRAFSREVSENQRATNSALLQLSTTITTNTEVTRAQEATTRSLGLSVDALTRTVLRQNGTDRAYASAYLREKSLAR